MKSLKQLTDKALAEIVTKQPEEAVAMIQNLIKTEVRLEVELEGAEALIAKLKKKLECFT